MGCATTITHQRGGTHSRGPAPAGPKARRRHETPPPPPWIAARPVRKGSPTRSGGGGIHSRGPAPAGPKARRGCEAPQPPPWVRITPSPGRALPAAEGVGFEPTRPFRVNALAGRRLKPLGHPSEKLPRLGSNQDSSDPESDVLPVTPRGILNPICALATDAGKPQATSRIRTDDPVITSDVLYQLSYGGDHADRPAHRAGQQKSGAEGNRTPDLSIANAALSQLSYGPSLPFNGRLPQRMGARGLEPLTSTMST